MRIVSGKFRGTILFSPKGDAVRPTQEQVRSCIFNMCCNTIEGATFLDLFAGSGAMGLEALSRGASFATFVEQDKEALIAIRKNIDKLGCSNESEVIPYDAFMGLKRFSTKNRQFDFIYIDPPYSKDAGSSLGAKALEIIDKSDLLSISGTLFLEDRVLKNDTAPVLSKLFLKSSRRFGSTCLKEFKTQINNTMEPS